MPVTPFIHHFDGPVTYAKHIKLRNRRVDVARNAKGESMMVFTSLRGWKLIDKKVVPLSIEATESLIQLLIDSQRTADYPDQRLSCS